MNAPSKIFIEKLRRELQKRRLSSPGDLDGFRLDLDGYFDNDGKGKPFRLMNSSLTDDESCKLIAEIEVVDHRPWTELKDEIFRIWNEELAYKNSEFEFIEDSSGQTFHFFTFEDDKPLFVTGQIRFRRA